jgi:hypothetical protein
MGWQQSGPSLPGACTGVLIRKAAGEYVSEPTPNDKDLLDAVKNINPEVALTMSTEGSSAIFDNIDPSETMLLFQNGSQIQIYDSMADVAASSSIKKFQYAALIRRERVFLVWHDDLSRILPHAMEVESRALALVWGSGASPFGVSTNPFATPRGYNSAVASEVNLPLEKKVADALVEEVSSESVEDLEAGGAKESLARPLVFTSSVYVGMAMLAILGKPNQHSFRGWSLTRSQHW